MGSNHEKNGGRKSRDTLSIFFSKILYLDADPCPAALGWATGGAYSPPLLPSPGNGLAAPP